ncbi:MAG: carbonic anhydrase [Verrucomicrobiae bacterium]|nr:carbonic anhydrase [Verrucomicrobiae bacterium]
MENIQKLLEHNKKWASQIESEMPGFFDRLSHQQKPQYLWIGCSDSRVPANQITGLLPGEIFVHRNISNLVINTDINLLSVLQYAVDILKVEHIIVCGHYGCGGVEAAVRGHVRGVLDHWLNHIRDIIPSDHPLDLNEICELNVKHQVENLANNVIVHDAWDRKQKLLIHGWVYSLENGIIKDLLISKGPEFSPSLRR